MGSIVIGINRCAERFRVILMEAMVTVPLRCPVFEEVLGCVEAIVNLGDVLDRPFLNV